MLSKTPNSRRRVSTRRAEEKPERFDYGAAGTMALDVLAVAIAVADVASDIAVAVQFGECGHWLWAGLVLASLFVACVVYSVLVLAQPQAYLGDSRGDAFEARWPLPLRILVVALVSPFLPLLVWLRAKVDRHCGCGSDPDVHAFVSEVPERYSFEVPDEWFRDTTPTVVHDIVERALRGTAIRHVVHGMAEHFMEHVLFFVETACESLPQALIQLLAMAVLDDEPSALQLFSVALSVVCIGSKAYVVAVSPYVSSYVFKFALSIFDLCAIFYTFASLMGGINTVAEVPRANSTNATASAIYTATAAPLTENNNVSSSTAIHPVVAVIPGIWEPTLLVFLWLAQAAVSLLLLVGFTIASVPRWVNSSAPCRPYDVAVTFGVTLLLTLTAPLALVAAQSAKLALLLLPIFLVFEPQNTFRFASWRLAVEFLDTAPDDRAFRRRATALLRTALRVDYLDWWKTSRDRHEGAELRAVSHAIHVNDEHEELPPGERDTALDPDELWWRTTFDVRRRALLYPPRDASGDTEVEVAPRDLVTSFFAVHVPLCTVPSLLFVPAHAALEYGVLSTVQLVCLWGAAGSLAVALLLLPRQVRLWRCGRAVLATLMVRRSIPGKAAVLRTIAAYFAVDVPTGVCVQDAVPGVPSEVMSAVVAPFIAPPTLHPLDPVRFRLSEDHEDLVYAPPSDASLSASSPYDASDDARLFGVRCPFHHPSQAALSHSEWESRIDAHRAVVPATVKNMNAPEGSGRFPCPPFPVPKNGCVGPMPWPLDRAAGLEATHRFGRPARDFPLGIVRRDWTRTMRAPAAPLSAGAVVHSDAPPRDVFVTASTRSVVVNVPSTSGDATDERYETLFD